MREKRQGEEKREQKGLEEHEQERLCDSADCDLSPTHKHACTRTQTPNTCVSCCPSTHTPLMHTKTSLPLSREHTFTLCVHLCATLRAIRRPLPLNRREGSQLTHSHSCKAHIQYKHSHTFKTHLPSAHLSAGEYSTRVLIIVSSSHIFETIHKS